MYFEGLLSSKRDNNKHKVKIAQNKKTAKKWSKWPQIKKYLTLFYETLKVEEIKVVLFFQLEVIWSLFGILF